MPEMSPRVFSFNDEEGGLSESDLNRVWDDLQSIIDTLEDDPKYQSISESLREVMDDMTHIMAQSGGGESDLGQIIGDELSNVEVTPRDDPGRIRREGPI